MKLILHIDMDAFFASVEENTNPSLRGKPVFVGGKNRAHTVVAACSYAAKEKGVKTGMSLDEAFFFCRDAVFIPGDSEKYIWASGEIFRILESFTPELEIFSIDEAFLDISGIWERYQSPLGLAAAIKYKIKKELQLPSSIGIGSNKLIAKLASKKSKPDGILWVKRKELDFLDAFEISSITGIGPSTQACLKDMGVYKTSDLRKLSFEILKSKFGYSRSLFLYQVARGVYSCVVNPEYKAIPRKSISESRTLDTSISDRNEIKRNIYSLSDNVAKRLRDKMFFGRLVHLMLRFSNMESIIRSKRMLNQSNDGYKIYQEACLLLDSINIKGKAVRALGIACLDLSKEYQSLLFEDPRRRILNKVIDKINASFGADSLSPASLSIDSKARKDYLCHGFLHQRNR